MILQGDDVKVKAKETDLIRNLRTKSMCSRNTKNDETFVIVGGGIVIVIKRVEIHDINK